MWIYDALRGVWWNSRTGVEISDEDMPDELIARLTPERQTSNEAYARYVHWTHASRFERALMILFGRYPRQRG